MTYYEMLSRTIFICVGAATILTFVLSVVANMIIDDRAEKEWMRVPLRVGNWEIHLLSLWVIYRITDNAAVAMKIAIFLTLICGIAVDLLFGRDGRFYNWLCPKSLDEEEF